MEFKYPRLVHTIESSLNFLTKSNKEIEMNEAHEKMRERERKRERVFLEDPL